MNPELDIDKPKGTMWFEVVSGLVSVKIQKRRVEYCSAAFVFHPNGRKSAKSSEDSSFFATFAEAHAFAQMKVEADITKLAGQLDKLVAAKKALQNLTEGDVL